MDVHGYFNLFPIYQSYYNPFKFVLDLIFTDDDAGFLFEGHLTVDREPPQPDWLVHSNLLTAAATLLAREYSHEGEGNISTSEDTAMLNELVNRLDDVVPMIGVFFVLDYLKQTLPNHVFNIFSQSTIAILLIK